MLVVQVGECSGASGQVGIAARWRRRR